MNRYCRNVILCGVLTTSLLLTACKSNNASDENTNILGISNTTVSAIVESVKDNEITLTLGSVVAMSSSNGNMGMGNAPSGGSSNMGTPPNSTDSAGSTGNAPEKPEDSQTEESQTGDGQTGDSQTEESQTGDGQADNSEAGQQMPQGESSNSEVFVEGETTAVLTIVDESVISIEGSDSDNTTGTLSDISEGSILTITIDEDGQITSVVVTDLSVWNSTSDVAMGNSGTGGNGNTGGAPGGSSSGVDSYDAVTEYTSDETVDGGTFESTGTDENAILVTDGANVTLNDITLNRQSSDSTGGDNSSFYGVGAGLLVESGTAYVNGGTFTTDASGGAGIFAYGDGIAYVADADITTTQDTSGGIHAAGGGTLYAWDLDVETSGNSSAAIRSDRGGGTMVVDGGSYTSNGTGSPAVYCTADIAINNAALTANGSEAICIEGLNSLRLFDCQLSGNMSDDDQNDCTWTIIVYQSMSGDSEIGNSTFQMVGGTLTSENGGLLYTTNTECTILMSDVDITYAEDSEFFLQCTGNNNQRGWGTSGSNGSDCHFTAVSQDMQGNVIWDSISKLDFYITDASTLTGAVIDDETYAGNGGDGYCNVYVSSDSKWVVTGDSTVSNLYNEGTIVDEAGNTVSIIGSDGTAYVEGTSSYTITVNEYASTVDLSEATSVPTWNDYAVERPTELN